MEFDNNQNKWYCVDPSNDDISMNIIIILKVMITYH